MTDTPQSDSGEAGELDWKRQSDDFNTIAIELAEHYWESRKSNADATYTQCLEGYGLRDALRYLDAARSLQFQNISVGARE